MQQIKWICKKKLRNVIIVLVFLKLIGCTNNNQEELSRYDSIRILKDSCMFKNLVEFQTNDSVWINNQYLKIFPDFLKNDDLFVTSMLQYCDKSFLYSWQDIDSTLVGLVFLGLIDDLGQIRMNYLVFNKNGKLILNEPLALSSGEGGNTFKLKSKIIKDTFYSFLVEIKPLYTKSTNPMEQEKVYDSLVYRRVFDKKRIEFNKADTIFKITNNKLANYTN